MKSLLIVLLAVVFAVSLSGMAVAQEKANKEEPAAVSNPTTEESAETAKTEEAKDKGKAEEKQASAKPVIWRMGGSVTALDPKAETISIHQETVHHDRVMKLRVSDKVAKELMDIKPGDLVNVWISDQVVTRLNKVS